MAKQVREYASDLKHLATIRAFIEAECRRAWEVEVPARSPHAGSPAELALDQLLLAVQEAATNIVRHGYEDEANRPIRVVLEVSPDEVQLLFCYPGKEFDPETVPPPVFDGSKEGGFGVYLIRQLVDEVRYHRDSAGLCSIHLHKKRSPAKH
jgi:serine/threonine-protein kinase RsbW